MPLKGDLKDFGLEELIQTIETGKKSGKLEIKGEMGIYGIFFQNGQIIHAFAPFAIGKEAINDAFLEITGYFSWIQNLILPPITIKKNSMALLIKAITAREECKNILNYINKNTVIYLSTDITNNVQVEAEEWKILKCIAEKKTILNLLEEMGLTYYNLCKILNRLLEKKLIIMEA